MKDSHRVTLSLSQVEGRLTYKNLVGVKKQNEEINTLPVKSPNTLNPKVFGRPVAQIKNGKVVAEFPTIKEAGEKTGILYTNISKVLNGKRKSTGGFTWKYL